MTDIALKNAEVKRDELSTRIEHSAARVAELQASIAKDREELERVLSFIRIWHEMAGTEMPADAVEAAVPDTPLPLPSAPKPKKPKNSDRIDVAKAAAEIIWAHGRPMSRSDLFQALIERGLTIDGKDPEMVLSTMLWRSKDIVTRFEGLGYWPADMPYAPAQYLLEKI